MPCAAPAATTANTRSFEDSVWEFECNSIDDLRDDDVDDDDDVNTDFFGMITTVTSFERRHVFTQI